MVGDSSRDKKARTGRFKQLAPWKDQDGVWRVGGRNRLTVPYTSDGKPAILLPEGWRYTYLAMLAAHNKAHPGVQQTVVQYRQDGWWSVRAGILAKGIKQKCVRCRYLDMPAMSQTMGQRAMEFSHKPSVWKHVEIDLMGPFHCRGEKNPEVQ